jgi:hypothetical protein
MVPAIPIRMGRPPPIPHVRRSTPAQQRLSRPPLSPVCARPCRLHMHSPRRTARARGPGPGCRIRLYESRCSWPRSSRDPSPPLLPCRARCSGGRSPKTLPPEDLRRFAFSECGEVYPGDAHFGQGGQSGAHGHAPHVTLANVATAATTNACKTTQAFVNGHGLIRLTHENRNR